MSTIDKTTLKSWFRKGMKPLEAHFAAWIDSYWHKAEQIPTSSIAGLEATLNSKAEITATDSLANSLNGLDNTLTEHKFDNQKHKTEEEQNKLDNLAGNPDAIYATKEELELLQASSAIVVDVDFTKTDAELETAAMAYASLLNTSNFSGKPFYLRFKYHTRPDLESAVNTTLVQSQSFKIRGTNRPIQPTATLLTPIVTRSEIDSGKTQAYARKVTVSFEGDECYFDIVNTGTPVPMKSFNLYFFPEGKHPWDWPAYRDENIGKTITGTLTRHNNESLFTCDKWDQLQQFITYDKFNENRMPPIFLRTIASGEKNLFKPATIDLDGASTMGGTRNHIYGFKLSVSNVEEIDGKKYLVEETVDIPAFTGYGSTYTYKFTITPVRRKVEVVTEYPTDLSGYNNGDIIIKQPTA